ncbi:MAG: metalloregulator ArsR/SmtB family transcription factor [Candidatus Saccharicenans sp.]|nr:metalloregulator ArsR/SmtB family transcription factor [Candidatus Saccharicenans sp.]
MKLAEAVRVFRVFSDRTRLRIFLLLLDSELCVGELMALLQMEQSLLSHQLKVMRRAGLVEARRSGRWIFYQILPVYRKQLEPLLRAWLKEELASVGQKVRAVKGKNVCRTSGGRPAKTPRPAPGKTAGAKP